MARRPALATPLGHAGRARLALVAALGILLALFTMGAVHAPESGAHASALQPGAHHLAQDTSAGHDAPLTASSHRAAVDPAPAADQTCASCMTVSEGALAACALMAVVVVLLALALPRRLEWRLQRSGPLPARAAHVSSFILAPSLTALSISRT